MEPADGARPLAGELTRAFRPVVWTLVVVLLLALGHFGVSWWVDDELAGLSAADEARGEAHEATLEQESSLRGYLLTGDPSYQEAYRDARARAEGVETELLRSVAGDDELSDLLLSTWNRRTRWTTEWAEVALSADDVGELGDRSGYVADGMVLFGSYREADAGLATALDGRIDDLRLLARIAFLTGLAASVVVIGTGLVLTFRQLRRTRQHVEQPLHDLLKVVRRVRNGDLSAVAQTSGPAELRMVADELGATTRALAEERTRADRREHELGRLADVAGRVLDYAQEFSSSLELDRVLHAIGRGALPLSGLPEARVWIVEHDDDQVVLAHAVRDDGVPPDVEAQRQRLGESLPGRAAQLGRTLFERDGVIDARQGHEIDGVALPMIAGGLTIGVLELRADAAASLDQTAHELLEKVSTQAGTALEAARMHGRTRELVRRDDLTGLMNRRQLDEDLAAELARYRRYQTPCTFILLDLDLFKELNDSLGHQAGDEFLVSFGALLRETLRTTDTAYRYGGEEFGVVLRESGAEDAEHLLERLRARVLDLAAVEGHERSVTFSGGIREADLSYEDPDAVIRGADQALYEAKRTGRDRWLVSGRDVVSLDDDTTHSSPERHSGSSAAQPRDTATLARGAGSGGRVAPSAR